MPSMWECSGLFQIPFFFSLKKKLTETNKQTKNKQGKHKTKKGNNPQGYYFSSCFFPLLQEAANWLLKKAWIESQRSLHLSVF